MRKLFINNRFFYSLYGVAAFYVMAFFMPSLMPIAHGLIVILVLVFILDVILLWFPRNPLNAQRILPEKLSNGDENPIQLDVLNRYFFPIHIRIIDEIPFQFQKRDFEINEKLAASKNVLLEYVLEPKERGNYDFGDINVYASSYIGFVAKRFKFQKGQTIKCYPSFIHLKKYELMAVQSEFSFGGVRKIRKLGHTMEFEQIREYVRGDDIRTINWKATSKHNKLMINQFQDEKSQQIYMLIDKGRTMQMPFKGLSLLDYSINATMALSHIILKKGDRAGTMTFSKKLENKVPAEKKSTQLKKISEGLYSIDTNFFESDYGRLYQDVKYTIKQRSLVILFSNFETLEALRRQLKYLRAISKNHVLLIVFFKNTELDALINEKVDRLQDVYDKIIAEKYEFEKKLIIQELRKYGIYSVYTKPENLNIDLINKYLEIKTRGII